MMTFQTLILELLSFDISIIVISTEANLQHSIRKPHDTLKP